MHGLQNVKSTSTEAKLAPGSSTYIWMQNQGLSFFWLFVFPYCYKNTMFSLDMMETKKKKSSNDIKISSCTALSHLFIPSHDVISSSRDDQDK